MRRALAIAGAAVVLAACGGGEAPEPAPAAAVTFHRDVAPILFEQCAPCHRPGGSGPFDLLTWDDARKRAGQIARVTRTGYMPPWLPVQGHGEFLGERRLTDDQIALLARWAEGGAAEGDPADAPPRPEWPDGWQLGAPDLVVEMPETYTLPAEGFDVYRNFVIPSGVDDTRWVRAVEFRAANPRIVHHARQFVDRGGDARRADARDAVPGYDGMEPAGAMTPDGVLIGWTPGRVPGPGRDDISWRLDGSTDLVLQLHMLPSGRPEAVRISLGLYFADGPPARFPFALVLGSRDIDLAPGATGVVVEERYELPVDVELLAVYPHAHYLGKTMHVTATTPAGDERSLLWIDDWDFNWQDEYRYAEPVPLPAGTTVAMRFTFDNSADNPRNPTIPPARVTYGSRTTDEMAEVMLQLLPRDRAAWETIARDYDGYRKREAIAYHERRLAERPDDVGSLAAVGSTYLALGRPDDAIAPLTRAVALAPRSAALRNNLGFALHAVGRDAEAAEQFRAVLAAGGGDAGTHLNLAAALTALGRHDEALRHVERAAALRPDSDRVRAALDEARRRAGR